MRVFDFDPDEYASAYADNGWVHIREGVSEEFQAVLTAYAQEQLETHKLDAYAIKGKKEQARFEFPSDLDFEDLLDTIATLSGLNRETLTLSERHIQIYDADAAPEPPAHKDRFPSQISVGLSVDIPAESRLVLYPYDHREVNPFNSAAGLRRSLQPDELPEVVLPHAREVELADRARDVVAFPGSSTWHLRRRAAGALNLYLKFNDLGCDPLGEDPRTDTIRSASLTALRNGSVDAGRPLLGRRFDSVTRRSTRATEADSIEAQVYGEDPFGITEAQLAAIKLADGRRPLSELAGESGAGRDQILRLVELGALDLVS